MPGVAQLHRELPQGLGPWDAWGVGGRGECEGRHVSISMSCIWLRGSRGGIHYAKAVDYVGINFGRLLKTTHMLSRCSLTAVPSQGQTLSSEVRARSSVACYQCDSDLVWHDRPCLWDDVIAHNGNICIAIPMTSSLTVDGVR